VRDGVGDGDAAGGDGEDVDVLAFMVFPERVSEQRTGVAAVSEDARPPSEGGVIHDARHGEHLTRIVSRAPV
jgi:hypothetical protein